MDIASIRSFASLTPGGAAPAAPKKDLGKDEFLRLLTTQLANQDPLSPMDNQAFIAQLAQFASVEQLRAVGDRLDTLLIAQTSANQMNTAALVGKDVEFRTSSVELTAGQPAAISARLPTDADVTVLIRDAAGRTVRTLVLGRRPAGDLQIPWDGHDERGTPMPPGRYGIVVSALGADGKPLSVDPRATGRVTGVEFADGAARLIVGSTRIPLPDVFAVHQG